jgi:hypothetical protein
VTRATARRPRSTTARVAIAASGVLLVGAYLLGAAISGRLSPLARRPLLDGTLTPTAYRWVDPPPALAAQNQDPTPGMFRVKVTDAGSRTAVFSTDDTQVTVILEKGAFPAAERQNAVQVTVTPIATSEVSAADRPLRLVGNAVRIQATYVPSGDPVSVEPDTARVVLVYPIVLSQHASHSIVSSPDGEAWTPAETNDLPSIQQADALVPTLDYVAVGEEPGASPSGSGSGVNTAATVAIVVAIVALLVVLFLTLRRRSASE